MTVTLRENMPGFIDRDIGHPHFAVVDDTQDTNYVVATFSDTLSLAQERELAADGLEVQEHLGNDTYICRYEPENLTILRNKDFVRGICAYRNRYPVAHNLSQAAEDGQETVDISFHNDIRLGTDATLLDIYRAVGSADASIEWSKSSVRARLSRGLIEVLAKDDRVRSIQPSNQMILRNELFSEEKAKEISVEALRFTGKGQTISIASTGLDYETLSDRYPLLRDRLAGLISSTQALDGERVAISSDEHSIQACSSALWLQPHNNFRLDAKLILTNVNHQIAPLDPLTLFQKPYQQFGTRIFSYSRSSSKPEEDRSAIAIDDFVWEHSDAVVLVPAGPATAQGPASRNAITVGVSTASSQSPRSVDREQSSQTPIRPDVVAPNLTVTIDNKIGTNARVANRQKKQATPTVAGCVAILREAALVAGQLNLPAALIKAALINGADTLPDLPRKVQGFGRVNLPNSVRALTWSPDDFADMSAGYIVGPALGQGETWPPVEPMDVDIPQKLSKQGTSLHQRLKVTLVYTDRAGAVLQNNLNLRVVQETNSATLERHGNMPADSDDYDKVNNVEQVVWDVSPEPGCSVKVQVVASNIVNEAYPQSFALVWQFLPIV